MSIDNVEYEKLEGKIKENFTNSNKKLVKMFGSPTIAAFF